MLTLAIETSNPTGGGAGVALVRDGLAIAAEALQAGARHDDALMPAIARVCTRAGVKPGDLQRVAVSIGPGGYTSLRIACATGKMICAVTGAQCVAVPTASALCVQVDAEGEVIVALAYKREDCWVHRFQQGGEPTGGDAGLMSMAKFGALLGDGVTLVADDAIAELLRATGASLNRVRVLVPRFDAEAVARVADQLVPIAPERLVPLYGREPEAVTKWRQLHGSQK